MKIIVVYNEVTSLSTGVPEDLTTEQDSVETALVINNTLKELGHDSSLLKITENNSGEIGQYHPDLFFNQAFGLGNLPKTEAQVAKLLEKTGKPYTGSGPEAIEMSNDKIATKYLFLKNHIPTPRFVIVDTKNGLPQKKLRFPLIVKLSQEHCSLGMHEDSVVFSKSSLAQKIANLRQDYRQEILVEEFIDGRELNVTVIGSAQEPQVLPISEITFGPLFKDKPKIVDFAAKWDQESEAYKQTVGVCPAKLDKKIEEQIKSLAKKVYQLCDCRDYARVDFRLGAGDKPYVLELNANPGIGPTDGTIRSVKASGLSYRKFLQQIVNFALSRAQNSSPYSYLQLAPNPPGRLK